MYPRAVPRPAVYLVYPCYHTPHKNQVISSASVQASGENDTSSPQIPSCLCSPSRNKAITTFRSVDIQTEKSTEFQVLRFPFLLHDQTARKMAGELVLQFPLIRCGFFFSAKGRKTTLHATAEGMSPYSHSAQSSTNAVQ